MIWNCKGLDWDFVTDIPWVHEVCCSFLRSEELHRSDQIDQLYEVLSEYLHISKGFKIQRHGIHFHVQYRNVHSSCVNRQDFVPIRSSNTNLIKNEHSYLDCSYNENYCLATNPAHDLNAWTHVIPDDCRIRQFVQPNPTIQSWERLLLAQEEALDEMEQEQADQANSISNTEFGLSQWNDQPNHEYSKRLKLSARTEPMALSNPDWMNQSSTHVLRKRSISFLASPKRESQISLHNCSPPSKRSKHSN